ncbi:MAG: hypothetical protein P8078_08525, partial [bacterium]
MKKLLLITFYLSGFLLANNNDRILNIKMTSECPVIDGVIDPCWSRADSAINFFQLTPYYNKKPSLRTV